MSLSAPVTPARYTRMQAFKGVSVTNAEGRKAYNEDTNEESGGSSQGLDDNGDEDVDDNCGDDDEEVIDGRTEYEACCLVKKQLLDLVYLWVSSVC